MDLYSIALFVHIVGALLLFVLLTIEGIGLRVGFASASVNRVLGPVSALAILIPGFYMVATQAGWKAWVAVGLVSWGLIAVAGTVTGISVRAGRMSHRVATISWLVRIGMAFGVVFDMTLKPGLLVSITAVVAGGILGAAASTARARLVPSA
jgi:hypothetical protein